MKKEKITGWFKRNWKTIMAYAIFLIVMGIIGDKILGITLEAYLIGLGLGMIFLIPIFASVLIYRRFKKQIIKLCSITWDGLKGAYLFARCYWAFGLVIGLSMYLWWYGWGKQDFPIMVIAWLLPISVCALASRRNGFGCFHC